MALDYICLENIEESIKKHIHVFTSMGVTNGVAGASLFYFYKSLTAPDQKQNLKYCLNYLQEAINGLTTDYKGSNIVTDILEIGLLIEFYREKKIIDSDECIPYFQYYEPILEEFLFDNLKNNNLNPVSGAIKFSNYFLNKNDFISKTKLFLACIDKIEEQSFYHEASNGFYWISNIERDGEYFVELGIKHGVMGIVDHLVKLYSLGFEKSRLKLLIEGALRYVEFHQYKEGKSLFPFSTDETDANRTFSFGITYGDIGIAYGLYRAGKICNLEKYEQLGLKVLYNSCYYRDNNNSKITDANLLYGNLGIASLFVLFQKDLNNAILQETIDYWLNKTEQYRIHSNQWAGFDSTFNKFDINTQLSFHHGIVGIGIALMNFRRDLDFDFLKFMNFQSVIG